MHGKFTPLLPHLPTALLSLCFVFCICTSLLPATLTGATTVEDQVPNTATVLILLGNDGDSTTGASLVLEGLISGFKKSGKTINVLRENLPINFAQNDSEQKQLARKVHEKYADHHLDLIISVAPLPTDFALTHRDLLFPYLPMVFCAHSATQLARLRRHLNLTGVAVSLGIEDTVRLIVQIHPNLRNLTIVAGNDQWDQYLLARTTKILSEFREILQPHILTGLTMEAMLRQISELPPLSAILYLSLKKDAEGKTFPFLQGLDLLSTKANAPIYSPLEITLGHGVVGGQMTDLRSYGVKASELALRVLQGESASEIDIAVLADFQPQFDGKMLRRWNIGEEHLPRGSVVINREESIWDRYRWLVIGGIAFAALQMAFIGFLLIVRQREKKVRRQLTTSQTNFRRAQEIALIGSFVVDLTEDMVSWSEGTHDLLGLPPTAQLTFQQFINLVHPDDRAKVSQSLQNLRNNQSGEDEFRLGTDAETKFVRIKWQMVEGSILPQQALTGIMQDVTALRTAEASTEHLRDNLIRLTRIATVEALSSKIVHEINQPLTAQRTNAEIALQLLDKESPDLDELRPILRDVLEDNLRIQTIVQDIRGLIKKKGNTSTDIDLSSLMKDAIKMVRASRAFDRITLLLDMPPKPLLTNGDAVQLQQVFINLIKNGFEACALSDVVPSCLTVTLREEDDVLYITVADMGNTITPQQAHRMFEPFFTTKEDGVGMGLAISRMIVEAHNGKMGYVENPNQGLTFWVRLPKENSPAEEA